MNVDEEKKEEGRRVGTSSDVETSRLMDVAAAISTFNRNGYALDDTGISVVGNVLETESSENRALRKAGIMVHRWVPTLGYADSKTDAVNVAADKAYRTNRRANSGARVYQAVDLMIVDQAADSIVNFWYAIRRIQGLLYAAMSENAYYGKPLIEALGYDYYDLRNHTVDLVGQLQVWAKIMGAYTLIPTFKYHDVHRALQSTVFTDGDIEKAQIYIFEQAEYLSYEKVDTLGGLTAVSLMEYDMNGAPIPITYNRIVEFGNALINAFMNSDDIALICGDTEKAYGDAAIITLPEVDFVNVVDVVEMDPILSALNNAVSMPLKPGSYLTVDRLDNVIKCTPSIASVQKYDTEDVYYYHIPGYGRYTFPEAITWVGYYFKTYGTQHLVNNRVCTMCESNPTPSAIGSATRFMPVIDADGNVKSCGTEFIVSSVMYVVSETAQGAWDTLHAYPVLTNMYLGESNLESEFTPVDLDTNCLSAMSYLSQFDWHHAIFAYVFGKGDDPSNIRVRFDIIQDVQNSFVLPQNTLARIHDARLLGAFDL